MPYELHKLEPGHLESIVCRPNQVDDYVYVLSLGLDSVIELGLGFTGFRDGKIIACSGIIPHWRGRAQAWAFYGGDITLRDYAWIFRETKKFLDMAQENSLYRRVESTVRLNFPEGHRFIRRLGFELEGTMFAYDPHGEAHSLYARIRHGRRRTQRNTLLGK